MLIDRWRLRRSRKAMILVLFALAWAAEANAAGESPDQPRAMAIGGAAVDLSLSQGRAAWFRTAGAPA